MIDIHNHILPGVDDGAKDRDISLAMLQEAVSQGVEELVLTPHLYEADIIKGTGPWKEKVNAAKATVLSLVAEHDLPIKVHVKAEVRYQDLIPVILEELDVLMGGKYMLLEFHFLSVPNHLDRIIYEMTKKGVVPVIAHPERIKPWQRDPAQIEELLNMGCPMQLDIGSILGTLGPASLKLAHLLLENDAVHLVGSDSHGLDNRPLYAKRGYDWLSDRYGEEYADILLKDNPKKILTGEHIAVYPTNIVPVAPSLKERIKSMFKR
ncbi:MAG: hypothetical protein K9M49_03230 [Candidatus Marinimicrobia bacterium]|nr:hypothetical protein [Candidatus Neomarinimicrobiota bacterium]MCF7851196.1 hypothetical protein [Candidatus Neomarinimicrobiota bacterium]MCF7904146.1 hypothetical protein [Candidatus Neomarinimicrobiota bacterium]